MLGNKDLDIYLLSFLDLRNINTISKVNRTWYVLTRDWTKKVDISTTLTRRNYTVDLNNRYHGLYMECYANHFVQTRQYYHGKLNGVVISKFKDVIRSIAHYSHGIMHGEYIEYTQNMRRKRYILYHYGHIKTNLIYYGNMCIDLEANNTTVSWYISVTLVICMCMVILICINA